MLERPFPEMAVLADGEECDCGATEAPCACPVVSGELPNAPWSRREEEEAA